MAEDRGYDNNTVSRVLRALFDLTLEHPNPNVYHMATPIARKARRGNGARPEIWDFHSTDVHAILKRYADRGGPVNALELRTPDKRYAIPDGYQAHILDDLGIDPEKKEEFEQLLRDLEVMVIEGNRINNTNLI